MSDRPERPSAIPPKRDGIPARLRENDQWVTWKYEWNDDRDEWTKVPYAVGDYRASSTNADTWASFDAAWEQYEDSDTYDGVGFVVNEDADMFLGLDLDDCIDPETDEWESWAEDLVARVETYWEVSPSGTGARGFALAILPEGGNRAGVEDAEGHLEMYDHGRYLTVTGARLDASADDVEQVNSAVKDVHAEYIADDDEQEESSSSAAAPSEPVDLDDQELIEKAKNASNGEKFADLWSGSTAGYESHSEADMALCCHLAFWTGGDEARIDSLFRDSGLMREKWDEDRGAQTYGERTIENAVKQTSDFYDPSENGSSDAEKAFEEIKKNATETDDAERERDDDGEPSSSGDSGWWHAHDLYEEGEVRKARYVAAETLRSQYDFATPRDTQELWEYIPDEGIFMKGGERTVDQTLARQLGEYYSTRERNEVIAKLKALTYVDREEFDAADKPLLCVENGVLNLDTRELMEHSPEFLFTRALPVEYDPDADPENITSFLDSITRREEDRDTMLEMVGHCLWPRYLKGKFMILFGEGSNGKSTFFDVLSHFLGDTNISGWDLQELAENRFASSALVGKFANIGGDMDSVKLKNTGVLKTLTGGDPTMVEEKGKPAFEFVNSATLMFAANRPPVIDEASYAIKRRLVPIRLPYEFTEVEGDGNPDARDEDDLLAELTTNEELSGLLNLALDGLDRLRENGDVSLPESLDERLEFYSAFSDPIKEFALTCVRNEHGLRVEKNVVYATYKRFAQERDYTIRSKNVFFRQLNQTSFTVSNVRANGSSGDRVQMLADATFTDEGLEYMPEYASGPSRMPDAAEAATDGGDDTTPVAALEPGFHDVVVEIAEVQDAPDWLAGKGHVVAPNGDMVPYVAEGSNPIADAGEGATVRLENAKVEDRKGIATIVMSGVTDATLLETPNRQDALDDSTPEDAESGTESAAGVDDVPADAEGVTANIQRLVSIIESEGRPLPQGQLFSEAGERHGISPSECKAALEKAMESGRLLPVDSGIDTRGA